MRASIVVVGLMVIAAAAAGSVTANSDADRLSELAGGWSGNWGSVSSGSAIGTGGRTDDPTHALSVTLGYDGTGKVAIHSGSTTASISGTIACDAPAAAGGVITCTIRRSDGLVQGMVGVVSGENGALTFRGSYVHFNMPGVFTTMYLRLTAPAPERHTVLVCEGSPLTMVCTNGTRVVVSDVLYGRDDTATCPYAAGPAYTSDTHCRAVGARDVVTRVCRTAPNSKSACTVVASNAVFGVDPCVNTYKFLRVTYECA